MFIYWDNNVFDVDCVLKICLDNIIINFIYSIYVIIYVQLVGKLFSKNFKAYSYLKSSAKTFPFGEKFKKILLDSSFADVQFKEKFFGASTIYVAQK